MQSGKARGIFQNQTLRKILHREAQNVKKNELKASSKLQKEKFLKSFR